MDHSLGGLRPYRQALAVSAATFVLVVAGGMALGKLNVGGGAALAALQTAALSVAVLASLLLIAAAATLVLQDAPTRPRSELAAEEPLLARPHLPAIRRDRPFIAIVGLSPRCGASTLAANLAILVATEGRLGTDPVRRPRALCLLNRSAGPGELTLDGKALGEYFREHPAAAGDDLAGLAVRHPSGAEFLSCAEGGPNGFQLRQILPVLRRYYDLMVFDVPVHDRWLSDAAIELADAVLLVTLLTPDAHAAIARWSDRIWGLGLEAKTILTINARSVGDPPLPAQAFAFLLEFPEEREIAERDGRGSSWALGTSCGARRFRAGFRLLLPGLLGERSRR